MAEVETATPPLPVVDAAAEVNPHAVILARHMARKAEKEKAEREAEAARRENVAQAQADAMQVQGVPLEAEDETNAGANRDGEAEPSGIKQEAVEQKANPHAAIIARHAARKAEKEKEEREERERLDRETKERAAKVTRKESLIKKKEELQQRSVDLLSEKPLEPKAGELLRYEGGLKGWKSRHCYIEDKLPLKLMVYKQTRNDGEFLDGYELTSDTVLEEQGMIRWGSQMTSDDGKSTISSKKSAKSAKPNIFTITINDKIIKMASDSAEIKEEWIECLLALLGKHHGLGEREREIALFFKICY